MAALYLLGTLSLVFAFGDDNRPFAEWLLVHIGLFGFAVAAFRTGYRLDKKSMQY